MDLKKTAEESADSNQIVYKVQFLCIMKYDALPSDLTRRILYEALSQHDANTFSRIRIISKFWEQLSYEIILERDMDILCKYLSAMRISSCTIPRQYHLKYALSNNEAHEKMQQPWRRCRRCNQVRIDITDTRCCKKRKARILNALIGPTIAVAAFSIVCLKLRK